MKKCSKYVCYWLLACFAFVGWDVKPALADLSIVPTHVLFEGRDRFKDVTLLNTGNDTKTYDISWEFYRMIGGDSDLIYETVDGSITDFDLTEHVVFTPRRVTLAPGGRQKIRLALRRPSEVPVGEYRAHLKFAPLLEEDVKPTAQEGFSAAINIRVGFSIPVVFQNGDFDASASIESMTLERNPQSGALQAVIKIAREGIHGTIGTIEIYDEAGNEIASVANAYIFSEADSRKFKAKLESENISGQNLKVVYRHYDKSKGIVFAERSFPIQ